MTEYISHWSPGVGLWLEVVPELTIQTVVLYIGLVILGTIIVARYYPEIMRIIADIKKV